MSDTTKIQWAHATFNPWIGCTKVSAGCANCYAENTTRARVLRTQGHETWGKGAKRSRTSDATWKQPLKWNSKPLVCECGAGFGEPCQCGGSMHRMRVFPSLCDWLDDEVPIEWLADFLKLIHDTPNLDWLLLTKRPENMRNRIAAAVAWLDKNTPVATLSEEVVLKLWLKGEIPRPDSLLTKLKRGPVSLWLGDWLCSKSPSNIWLGVSAENQATADKRIPELLKIPAKVRFVSAEPLLGEIDFGFKSCIPNGGNMHDPSVCGHSAEDCRCLIDWIIFGGESGPGARPCNVEWIRSGVKQCQAAGVKTFVKQLGSRSIVGEERNLLVDKKGGDWNEFPWDFKVREFPSLPSLNN